MRLLDRKIVLILIVLTAITLVTANKASSSNPANSLKPNAYQDELLLKSIEYIYADSFRAAHAALDSILLDDPDYWPANVFKIGVLYTEIDDDADTEKLDQFYDLIDSTEKGIDNYLQNNPDDKWGHYFKGIAMGYWALYEGYNGSWLKGVLKGLEAGKHYSRALEIDSTFYEAYLGEGSLNYWRSAKMGFATSLPFIPDRREEGIEQVKVSIEKSKYSSLPATTGLAWIYFNAKEYRKAIRLMHDLMNRGYRGRQVLWPKGLAAFKIGHSEGVISSFTTIKEGLERKGNQNYYRIGLCDYYLGVAYYWRGEYVKALYHLNALLDREVDKDIAKRLGKKYDKADEYKDKIKKAVAKKLEEQRAQGK